MKPKEIKDIQKLVTTFMIVAFTATTALPAWGDSFAKETLAPPMDSPATIDAIRRALDGGVGKVYAGLEEEARLWIADMLPPRLPGIDQAREILAQLYRGDIDLAEAEDELNAYGLSHLVQVIDLLSSREGTLLIIDATEFGINKRRIVLSFNAEPPTGIVGIEPGTGSLLNFKVQHNGGDEYATVGIWESDQDVGWYLDKRLVPDLLARASKRSARDGGDKEDLLREIDRQIRGHKKALAKDPTKGGHPKESEFRPWREAQIVMLEAEKDRLEQGGEKGSRDGGGRIATRLRSFEEEKTGLENSYEFTSNERAVSVKIRGVEVRIASLKDGDKIFINLDKPLSNYVLDQARSAGKPIVIAYDLAYFFSNPGAWVEYWDYIQKNPNFGQIEGSGIISVLLPYAYTKDIPTPEGRLVGIDTENVKTFFRDLNKFTQDHTGEKVNLRPEHFGLVVPSDRLLDPTLTKAFIQEKTGYSLNRIIARKEVAEAYKALETTFAALVFNLPFGENEVGSATLAGLFEIPVEEGNISIVAMPSEKVNARAAETLRAFQDIYTKF